MKVQKVYLPQRLGETIPVPVQAHLYFPAKGIATHVHPHKSTPLPRTFYYIHANAHTQLRVIHKLQHGSFLYHTLPARTSQVYTQSKGPLKGASSRDYFFLTWASSRDSRYSSFKGVKSSRGFHDNGRAPSARERHFDTKYSFTGERACTLTSGCGCSKATTGSWRIDNCACTHDVLERDSPTVFWTDPVCVGEKRGEIRCVNVCECECVNVCVCECVNVCVCVRTHRHACVKEGKRIPSTFEAMGPTKAHPMHNQEQLYLNCNIMYHTPYHITKQFINRATIQTVLTDNSSLKAAEANHTSPLPAVNKPNPAKPSVLSLVPTQHQLRAWVLVYKPETPPRPTHIQGSPQLYLEFFTILLKYQEGNQMIYPPPHPLYMCTCTSKKNQCWLHTWMQCAGLSSVIVRD